MKTNQAATAENVIPLATLPRPAKLPQHRQRFKIQPYVNPRTGSQSWRVTGIKRDGSRVRENAKDIEAAQCRQVELETEWLARQTDTAIRATKLTDAQVRLAETAFLRLDADHEMLLAVEYWLKHGRQLAVAESPRLDEAFKAFCDWLPKSGLRSLSQNNLRRRVNVFVNSVANLRVSDISHDVVQAYLDKRNVSALSKDNDRRAVSGFFTWCIERPRRWMAVNPCREIRIARPEKAAPAVLTVKQCETLLQTAEAFKGGRYAPFTAVSLFAGLRPFEVARLTWPMINLEDGEIRLEGIVTKTGRPRVVMICKTLAGWLRAYKGKPFYPPGWLKDFRKIKKAIGYGSTPDLKTWTPDLLRHSAVSHYFRKTGSYGETAEQFGNSESIIKNHYQGRVSSEETKAFYALLPKKGGRK